MLYTQFNKLLVVGGDLAASSNCCCQDSVEDCAYLPAEFLITLSGMASLGNYYSYTDNTHSPVSDPHARYVCPSFLNAWDGKTYRRYSTIDCQLADGTWTIVGEKAAFGWQWVNRDIPSKVYAHVASTPPATGFTIREYDHTLLFSLVIEDCVIGPDTFTISAGMSGSAGDPWRTQIIAAWETEVTLAPGETLRDKLPLTLDPKPNPWGTITAAQGTTAADYGAADCSGFVPYATGTNYVTHPGCILDAA